MTEDGYRYGGMEIDMKQYEYKVIPEQITFVASTKQYNKLAQEFETMLNELGLEGWEFVQRADGMFFFKREI